MYLIDTNIFLEVLLSRNRKKDCKKLLALVRDSKITGVVTDFTIYSIMILMANLNKLDKLKRFLLSLTAYKGLYIYSTSLTDKINAVQITKEQKLDIDDAIQYSAALSVNAKAIVSFDKDFNGLRIPRKEPAEILHELKYRPT